MALRFNEGAYGQVFQQGEENRLGNERLLSQLVTEPLGKGIEAIGQAYTAKEKSDREKALYELQLKEAQRLENDASFENMPLGQLLSSNNISSPVVDPAMVDDVIKKETPQMGMVEKFRMYQQGKLNQPVAPEPDLSPFGIPQEAAGLSLKNVKRLGEARKLFSDIRSEKIPTSLEAILARKVDAGEMTFDEAAKEKARLSPSLESRISNQNRSAEGQMRSQYLSQSKDFSDTAASYQRIVDSSKNPSAAGDLAMIFNYMKMLDPGSTVREGEFANAENSGSLPQTLTAQYNKILSGERLAPQIRADFLGRATQLYKGQKQRHDQRTSEFKRIATDSRLNPANVIVDLSTPVGGFESTSPLEPSGQELVQRNKRTGQIRKSFDGGKTWQLQ